MMALFVLILTLVASPAWAAIYYADNLVTCVGNYNISTRACTGSDGNSYTTIAAGVAPLQPGDTLYVRPFSGGAGVWNEQINLVTPTPKDGTAGNPITVAGYPGETVTFRYTNAAVEGYGTSRAWGRSYITFRNMVWDGANLGTNTAGIQIRSGTHHFTLREMEIKSHNGTAIYVASADDTTIVDCNIHDQFSTVDAGGSRHYGMYLAGGARMLVERNQVYHNSGGGIQLYTAVTLSSMDNAVVRYNRIYENNTMQSSQVAGITIQGASTNPILGAKIYSNVVYRNGKWAPTGGGSDGINIIGNATGTEIYNNTVYDNQRRGIGSGGNETGTIIRNNISIGNGSDDYLIGSSGLVASNNACTSGESCGTSKITISDIDDCVVAKASDDFRLEAGTNPCRNAGTAVPTLSSYVVSPDVGAYEQGEAVSATTASGVIEVTVNLAYPSLLPSSAITGFSVTCIGCSGTPVVASAGVKSGTNNIVQLTLSGISSSGSCSLTLSTNNMTDSLLIGGRGMLAQGIQTASLSVTGTCQNLGGSGPPSTPIAYYKLNDGSGTTANDETANNNDGTVSSGITWQTVYSGSGLRIPSDTTFRHLAIPFGASRDLSTNSAATCAVVKPDTTYSQKVVFSSGGNGTSQRFYFGWVTVGGQLQWGIGIQGSGFTTGSEFPATNQLTFVCLVADSSNDTATLWVGRTKGTQAGLSVKTYTSFTLVGDFRYGNDATFTSNNGGFDLDEVYVWDHVPSDSDIQGLYDALFPTSASLACYKEQNHQWQRVYVSGAGAPENVGGLAGSVEVVAGGAVAIVVQVDCVGSAGASVAFRMYYTKDGSTYLPVPDTIGADGVSMWGDSTDTSLNRYAPACCLSGALTPNDGATLLTSSARPTIALSQNHSYVLRYIVRVGDIPGQSIILRLQQDSGATLSGGETTTPIINVIQRKASTGF